MADGSLMTGGAKTAEAGRLRSFVERIERLEEERATIMADQKEVYAEAKSEGYDSRILRQVIRIRKMDTSDRQEQEALLDLYLAALGEDRAGPGS